MRHRPSDRDLSSVFEPDRQAAGKIIIGDCCACTFDTRGLCQAACAGRLLRRLERQSATAAAGFTEEVDQLPAIGTEAVNVRDDRAATGAARRKRKIERRAGANAYNGAKPVHCFLSRDAAHRTSRTVPELFDMKLRALRRDRAARIGPELFLLERAFDDCLQRIALMNRRFDRALLIGCPDPGWPDRLGRFAAMVERRDPGPLFAGSAGGEPIIEDAWGAPAEAYDLVVAVGTLDTVNELPLALRSIRHAMRPDSLFIGAVSGGDTLPRLRAAMRAADSAAGIAVPHVHPRIEASALSPLLADAGFSRPVVDVERVQVAYRSLDRLVSDLRAMGATNVLSGRGPPLTRVQRDAASRSFTEGAENGRIIETFELLHFAAWTAS